VVVDIVGSTLIDSYMRSTTVQMDLSTTSKNMI